MFSKEKWKTREEANMIEGGGVNGMWKEGMYSYEGEGKMEL